MLYTSTLSEISNNINTGVEYEIALFYQLLKAQPDEQSQVMTAINQRHDAAKVQSIIANTDTSIIECSLHNMGLTLSDISFETQNDDIGPADIVLHVQNDQGTQKQIGLSVKYANTCTCNVTGRNFITDAQIDQLKKLLPSYTDMYVKEMTQSYGDVNNWFHKKKPSSTTDKYIDLIRDAVIANWENVKDKATLLSILFHSNSPIEFWVVTYGNKGYSLRTKPQTIDVNRADDVTVGKYQTSYIAFYLDSTQVARMQVKFNNGFVEKCKKRTPDFVWQGVKMSYGQPYSSWNFNVEK